MQGQGIKEFTKPLFDERSASGPTASNKVFITGATGYTGAATIQHLLNNYKTVQIIAGVRDREKGRDALPSNIQIVQMQELPGNKDSLEMLANQMTGCGAVLIVPPEENRVEVSKAYVEAAQMAKVKFICLISVASINNNNNNINSGEEDLMAHQFRKIEIAISATAIKHAFLRCELFMENHLLDAPSIKKEAVFRLPVAPDAQYCPVCTSDVGAMAAAVIMHNLNVWQYQPIGLPQSAPTKEIYHLTSPKVTTMTNVAAIYSKIANTDVKYVQIPREQASKQFQQMGLSLVQAEGMVELYEQVNKGNNKKVSNDIETVLQRKALTIDEFLVSHKKEFV